MFRSLALLLLVVAACGNNNNNGPKHQCNDGIDNDGDGLIDFPDDPGCVSPDDDSEDSLPSPQCSDGRDNDGDGKIDFPNDPGCFAPQQDDETDDCPDGPLCPQCSNGKDDDNNGETDYPNDPGCSSASDTDEYTENPAACGSNVHIKKLPFDGHATGMLMTGVPSSLMSPTCGGGGAEDVYELRISSPKVVVATTDNAGTTADTVLYIRGADCVNNTSELVCNDDAPMATTMGASAITYSISTPGTYYLVVDAHDSGTSGTYDMQVKFLTGEGEVCSGPDDCGPGLVCRIPLGGSQKVCSKHVCSDGVDDDGDGKADYPTDPGCTSPDDDDESDPCPGAGCPECADGIDNDHDGKIDYPADPTCTSAADASEACPSTDGVALITGPTTMGDTTGAHDDVKPTCAFSGAMAPDKVYRLDVPALASLTITTTPNFDAVTALYDSTCGGTALDCQDTSPISKTNLAAGSYYVVVDGWDTGFGTYTLTVNGKIANNMPCESPLTTAGAVTCNFGYACKGTVGSKTCQPALCSDGIDNDGDGKIDYPFDPGCTDPADDTEADPATPPVCHDGMDNDGDGATDFPADFGCAAASGTSEVFCTTEHDPASAITTKTTTGTTAGKANDEQPMLCSNAASSNAPDVAYGLMLPVPVASLQIDLIGSSYDTMLTFRDASCGTENACDDDSGGSLTSKLTLTNVSPGGYAIVVDGYSTNSGAFTLNVQGTVAVGTPCDATLIPGGNAALFAGGANAVLKCPASCSAATHRCL